MPDRMIPIAIINSRSETMVVASLLDAAGILVHIGGYNHASVAPYPLALGGFRLTVPSFQRAEASAVIMNTPGYGESSFSYGLRRSVLRFLTIWVGLVVILIMPRFWYDPEFSLLDLAFVPLAVAGVPVNPQGAGEYLLTKTGDG